MLGWVGLGWVGLGWVGLWLVGMCLSWTGLGWVLLGWVGLGWVLLDWVISCHVFVLGISTFPLSTILIFDFVITFLISICFDSDIRRDSMYQMTRSSSMISNRKGVLIKFLPTDHQMECESGSNLQASRCK